MLEGTATVTRAAVAHRPKSASVIASHLRGQIIRGELPAGGYMPREADLLSTFGVSRPTLREGLRILESEGLISIQRGARGGARVQAPREERAASYLGAYLQYLETTTADVHAAIVAIEVPAVMRLAVTRTDDDLAAIEAVVDEGDAFVGDAYRYIEVDVRLHRLIVDRSGNKSLAVLRFLLDEIQLATARSILSRHRTEVDAAGALPITQAVHRRLLGLLRDRDGAAAGTLWQHHLMAANPYVAGRVSVDGAVEVV